MRLSRIVAACAGLALIAAAAIASNPATLWAQEEGGGGAIGSDNDQGAMMDPSMPANDPSMTPPLAKMHISQPITGSMLAAPPYGLAPMRVGFFVLADDPEGLGFLTYSWNFGDGTVSALPPELYIFHTYQLPGSYLCSLTVKTVDGRSQTFMQGIVVKPAGG
jgi:PKD domain-containing protein